jgi:hypothetical protein
LGWNGAPIPTYNPLYIIYNFQQEVLFFCTIEVPSSSPRCEHTSAYPCHQSCRVCTRCQSPNPRHYISFAKSGN